VGTAALGCPAEEGSAEARDYFSCSGNRMKQIPKNVVLLLLRGYKWAVSPMFLPACRYVPTCSEYAMEAVDRHGVVRGGFMAIWRVLRCHPWAKGGLDLAVKPKMVKPKSSSVPVECGRETELCSH
jgi:putative membrane protein insertion efficiency factor